MNITVIDWENISYRTRLTMVPCLTNNVTLSTEMIVTISTDSVKEHGQYLLHLVPVVIII